MIQNIIDDLKNQGIQPDLVQFELIKSLVENYLPKKNCLVFLARLLNQILLIMASTFGVMLEGVKQCY